MEREIPDFIDKSIIYENGDEVMDFETGETCELDNVQLSIYDLFLGLRGSNEREMVILYNKCLNWFKLNCDESKYNLLFKNMEIKDFKDNQVVESPNTSLDQPLGNKTTKNIISNNDDLLEFDQNDLTSLFNKIKSEPSCKIQLTLTEEWSGYFQTEINSSSDDESDYFDVDSYDESEYMINGDFDENKKVFQGYIYCKYVGYVKHSSFLEVLSDFLNKNRQRYSEEEDNYSLDCFNTWLIEKKDDVGSGPFEFFNINSEYDEHYNTQSTILLYDKWIKNEVFEDSDGNPISFMVNIDSEDDGSHEIKFFNS